MITFQPFIGGSIGSAPITTTGKITGGSFATGSIPVPTVVAATPLGGFALQNATPSIISWTTPNDGQLHAVELSAMLIVSTAQTGGAVIISCTIGGQVKQLTIYGGGAAAGVFAQVSVITVECDPNTTVSLLQQTALTAGAANVYAEFIGA